MRNRGLLFSLVLSTLVAAGAAGAAVKSSDSARAGKPVTIGVLAPFSGDYASYGAGYMRGIKTWIKIHGTPVVNGQKVVIKQLDDRCDVATGIAAFRRNATQLTAVFGPSCSSIAPPLAPLIKQYKVPMLDLGHAASITLGYKDGWIFRISQPDAPNQSAFGNYLLTKWKKQGITKIGVIADTSVTDANAAKSWSDVAKAQGVEVVATASFDFGVTDFSSQILKLQQAGAQGYILQVYGPDESRIIRQMTDLKVKAAIASAEDTPYPFVINKQTGPGIEGAWFYTDYLRGAKNPVVHQFEQAFTKVAPKGVVPMDIDYEGWLAMSVLVNALKQPGASNGGTGLQTALQKTHLNLGGRLITFLPNGDQTQVLTYAGRVINGKPVLEKLIVKPRTSFPDWKP